MTEHNALIEALPGASPLVQQRDGWWMIAPKLDVVVMAQAMKDWEARFSTMTGMMAAADETYVTYHFCLDQQEYNFKVTTQGNRLPSISNILPAADWIEREIQDLYKVEFTGHPHPERLLRPVQLSAGFFREPGGAESKAQQR